jgi:hypothetical protein
MRLGAAVAAMIEEHLRMATETGHHHILPAIVVQVTEGSAASGCGSRASGVGAFEPAIMIDRHER